MLLVNIDVVLDRTLIRDVLKAILSIIFFHRFLSNIRPVTPPQEVLDVTYPAVQDAELESTIADVLGRVLSKLDSAFGSVGQVEPVSKSPDHGFRQPIAFVSSSTIAAPSTTSNSNTQIATATSLPMSSAGPRIVNISASGLAGLSLSTSRTSRINVEFYERKTRKAWFGKSEEEVCWEQWAITIVAAIPRDDAEKQRLHRAAELQLQNIMNKVIKIAGDYKDEVPALPARAGNPFPYQITLPEEQDESWGAVIKRILVE
ncbi:autophagy-related protein [Lipomyces oligophaga]|uniref:autophagy-related protein n=1 Tax=Lipomyces oligophaga TaxID=45792 RepID=UPI0034CE2410